MTAVTCDDGRICEGLDIGFEENCVEYAADCDICKMATCNYNVQPDQDCVVWSCSTAPPTPSPHPATGSTLALIITGAVALAIVLALLAWCCVYRCRQRRFGFIGLPRGRGVPEEEQRLFSLATPSPPPVPPPNLWSRIRQGWQQSSFRRLSTVNMDVEMGDASQQLPHEQSNPLSVPGCSRDEQLPPQSAAPSDISEISF
jgi:hypothetical protein